jgi:hypothetical protein
MSHMTPEEKTERAAVRLTPTEAEWLAALADADGLSQSDVLRLLVRREYAARFGAAKKPARAKR